MIPGVILLSVGGSIAVDGAPLASLPGSIEVTAGGASIALTVDARAAVAFAQRFQRLGVRVDLDRGDGTMLTLPDRDIGDGLVIEESTDAYGDKLTLTLVGERYSPFARKLLQSRPRVGVYFRTGAPGNEYLAKVFTGNVISSGYDVHPPSADVIVLDAAGLYSEKRAKDWSLPPNSGRTRLSITTELLGLGEIPVRLLDLGGAGGGIVNKPHTIGDSPILDFLRDFLGAICVEVGFERGGFVARRFDPNTAAVLELNPSNLFPQLSLSPPEVLSPNVLGVVSTSSTRTEVGGLRTTNDCVVTVGPYAPLSVDGPLPVAERTIHEVCTKTTFLGSLDVHTEQTTRGWYAVLAAGAEIRPSLDPPGYEIVPTSATVYVYPDGSTRGDSVERFRRLRKMVRDKIVDDANRVVRVTEAQYFFHFLRTAMFQVTDGLDVLLTETALPVNDDGQAVVGGREGMGLLEGDEGSRIEGGLAATLDWMRPDTLTETDFVLTADGSILSETKTENYYSIGETRRRADGVFGYGTDPRAYSSRPGDAYPGAFEPYGGPWGGRKVTTTSYRAVDEDRYEVTVTVRVGTEPPQTEPARIVVGALPRPERAEPTLSAQSITATYEDRERIAMAGEEIEDIEHNEFVETREEAEALARHRARLASAITLSCSMPIEGLVHKWRAVRVNVPGASIDGLLFHVRTVRRDAAAFSQAITAAHYAPGI
jgi:hypothetical protein